MQGKFSIFADLLRRDSPEALRGVRGATPSQVSQFTQFSGRHIPDDYYEFIKVFGGSLGNLQILEDYDFSIDAAIALIRDIASPSDPKMVSIPVGANSGFNDEQVYIALADYGRGHAVYFAESATTPPPPDVLLSNSFAKWAILSLSKSAMILNRKHIYRICPNPDWKYMGFTRVVDVDRVVWDCLLSKGFSCAFQAFDLPLFLQGSRSIAAYERRPNRRVFDLTIGTDDVSLGREIQSLIASRLRCRVEVEP